MSGLSTVTFKGNCCIIRAVIAVSCMVPTVLDTLDDGYAIAHNPFLQLVM